MKGLAYVLVGISIGVFGIALSISGLAFTIANGSYSELVGIGVFVALAGLLVSVVSTVSIEDETNAPH